jgi:uncharacterized membrane protein YadS
MIRLLFLIPVVLCLIWILYLQANNYSLKQGKQGFVYILIFSAAVATVYTLLMFLTA